MKHLKLFSFVIILLSSRIGFSQNAQPTTTAPAAQPEVQNVLSGKIMDSASKTTLPGAVVYVPDLKVAAQTGADGTYTLNNLPKGTFVVEVHILGYQVVSEQVKIIGATTKNFMLVSSEFQEDEVVVTGNSKATESQHNPQPTTDVSNEYLNEHSSTNVIDAIATAPGVSAETDGQSISKPFIRGLGYNRVLTINDGVEQVDQPWFDEFGIEADPDAVDRYEILKGPGSLAYGSDAISGVVNLIPEEPLPAGQTEGKVLFNYQTNNGLINNMFALRGTSMGGVSWSLRADNTMAHAYQDPYDGYVLNSQFSNFNSDGTIGIHKKWGYTQLHLSSFYMNTGIVDGTRDSAGNQLMPVYYTGITPTPPFPFAYVEPNQQDQKTYTPFIIYQYIHHYMAVLDNSIAVGSGQIKATFSYQRNQREEMNDPTQPNLPIIYYNSNGITYDARYVAPQIGGFNFSVGANGVYQNSQSLGAVQLVPNYNYLQIGGFAIASEKIGNLNLSGGLRYDTRTFTGGERWIDTLGNAPQTAEPPNTYGSFEEFHPFTSVFSGVSGSFGATYDFTQNVYIKANIARGWRAPNVNECGAFGVHDGTVVFEVGDNSIKPETNLEEDLTFGINSKDVNFEVTGFVNTISDFIYARGLLSKLGGDSISNLLSVNSTLFPDAPVFKYVNGNAQMEGGEMTLDIHPSGLKWLELNSTVSYVTGGLTGISDSTKYLPFVPPMRITGDLIFHFGKFCKSISDAYLKFGVMNVAQQSDVYREAAIYTALSSSATPFEYAASQNAEAGYTLFNAGLGCHFLKHTGQEFCELYVTCNNLTNVGYMDYMSRFKYYPVNPGTDRVGVFNMGRNVSIKLIIPIDIKSGS